MVRPAHLDHSRVVWDPSRLGPIDPDARILVVGIGAAAVQVLVELAARGHEGRIVVLSQSGVWGWAGLGHDPSALATVHHLREAGILVDRAAEIRSVRAFSSAFVVQMRLTGADQPSRAGRDEIWTFEHLVVGAGAPERRATPTARVLRVE